MSDLSGGQGNGGKQTVMQAIGITKVYNQGKPTEVTVLKNVDLEVRKGDFMAIVGPSGSGKTTLLDVLGCLLRPTAGRLLIEGRDVGSLGDRERAMIRGKKIGFVFQQYNLIPSATAAGNVELALRINGVGKGEARKRSLELLKTVGLGKRAHHRPGELSGGEQQRVAIARALANNPGIILADEPTGNLDTATGAVIMELLREFSSRGYTIVMISHDPRIAKQAERIIKLKDGEIVGGA